MIDRSTENCYFFSLLTSELVLLTNAYILLYFFLLKKWRRIDFNTPYIKKESPYFLHDSFIILSSNPNDISAVDGRPRCLHHASYRGFYCFPTYLLVFPYLSNKRLILKYRNSSGCTKQRYCLLNSCIGIQSLSSREGTPNVTDFCCLFFFFPFFVDMIFFIARRWRTQVFLPFSSFFFHFPCICFYTFCLL